MDGIVEYGIRKEGIQLDVKRLNETFSHFGYDILVFKNLRAAQIKTHLIPYNLKAEVKGGLDQYGSLVVCILSHGEKGTVLGVDGAPVLINQLQYAFNGGNCPELAGKPKIFIILACQGNNEQMILEQSKMQLEMKMTKPVGAGNQLPPLIDFLTLMSTVEEFMSYYCNLCSSLFT